MPYTDKKKLAKWRKQYHQKKKNDKKYKAVRRKHKDSWAKSNPDKVREYKIRHRRKMREEVTKRYGGKCVCCGETQFEFLTFDHINNDGAEHRKKVATSYLVRWLKKNNYPKDIVQILCYNCNNAKSVYGECPHKLKNDKKG